MCLRDVLAVLTHEPVLTHALVVVDEGEADAVVVAGLLSAQVCHCLTIAALIARGTGAGVAPHVTRASGPVLTRIVFGADINTGGELAVRTVIPRRALAGIIIMESGLKQKKFMSPADFVPTNIDI